MALRLFCRYPPERGQHDLDDAQFLDVAEENNDGDDDDDEFLQPSELALHSDD